MADPGPAPNTLHEPLLASDVLKAEELPPLPIKAEPPKKPKITWRFMIGIRPGISKHELWFVYARLVVLAITIILPFAIYSNDLSKVREAWYTPFLAIIAAAIPASGAPIAGGIIFVPVLQLDSLTLRNAIAFSTATQMLGVGIFAPLSWIVRDRNIFLVKAIILGTAVGIFGLLMVLLVIPDPGDEAIQIVFLIFIACLAANTAWGIYRGGLLVQDEKLKFIGHPWHVVLFIVLSFLGGMLTGYIAIGIDKILFMVLTSLHKTHPTKSAISCITIVGLVSVPACIIHFARSEVPVNYWVTAIPGLLIGSMIGPVINVAFGSKRVLQAFVLILVIEVARSIQLLATQYH